MIPGLGWSVSDIALACKVIYKVCGAFRDATGADGQYASTVAFLDAFGRTLERINEYSQSLGSSGADARLSDDLTAQMKLIYSEYSKFDSYLRKAEPGLSSASFASRITARAKWGLKEINQKVDGLKKAVISPMMFVAPLLSVEVLRELKELRSHLPASSALQEAALRENRALILQTNSDIAHLRSNLDSYWWNRRWAMTAVEQDVQSLSLVVKNNSGLIQASQSSVEDTISREASESRREQAAANIVMISALESAMASRLLSIEAQIDVIISETRQQTGAEDKELHNIKIRVSNSRKHLSVAASSAKECLVHFGFLVNAVHHVHRNPVTNWMRPFADMIIGCNSVYESGGKMFKAGGKTVQEIGKYAEGSQDMTTAKAAVGAEKKRLAAVGRKPENPSVPNGRKAVPIEARSPVLKDEGYDSGEDTTNAIYQPARSTNNGIPTVTTGITTWRRGHEPRRNHTETLINTRAEDQLLSPSLMRDVNESSEVSPVHGRSLIPMPGMPVESMLEPSTIPSNRVDYNPWA